MQSYSPEELQRRISCLQLEERNEALSIIEDFRCSVDPLYWAQTYTATENPHYIEQGLPFRGPFPRKSYFPPLFAEFSNSSRLLVPKSREMLTSWCAMVWATNRAQWHQAEVVIQCQGEDKVKKLIAYAECLHRNQSPWLLQLHPLAGQNSTELSWKSGGKIIGVPKGVHQIRSYHPTIYIMDEAAFLEEAEACYNTAHPVSKQIIAVSSAAPGWFGNECSR